MTTTSTIRSTSRHDSARLLKAAVAALLLGYAYQAFGPGSPLAAALWRVPGVDAGTARTLDVTFAGLALACGLGGLLTRFVSLYAWVGLWIFAITASACLFGGGFGAPYVMAAHSIRYMLPLILIVGPLADVRVAFVLRAALALVFATHGLEAWQGHPIFVDLVLFARDGLLPSWVALDEGAVRSLLQVIAVQDVVLALLVLVWPRRAVLGYMAFWGLVTALARWAMAPEWGVIAVLVRAPHFLVPSALLLLWRRELLPLEAEAAVDGAGAEAAVENAAGVEAAR